MSDQAAPPEAAGQGEDTDKLHQYALDAEKNLEKLATGLAHAGVDKSVTSAVTKMADSMRKIVQAMGKTQPPPEAEPEAPAERETMDSAADGMIDDVRAAREH